MRPSHVISQSSRFYFSFFSLFVLLSSLPLSFSRVLWLIPPAFRWVFRAPTPVLFPYRVRAPVRFMWKISLQLLHTVDSFHV